MIPFINVIFLLMVFFLLAITWQKAEGVLENRIPQIKTRSDSESSRAWETVSLKMKVNKDDGRIRIYLQDRELLTYMELLLYLKQLPDDILIVLQPDNDVSYKHVIGVYNTCLKSKKKDIIFSIS